MTGLQVEITLAINMVVEFCFVIHVFCKSKPVDSNTNTTTARHVIVDFVDLSFLLSYRCSVHPLPVWFSQKLIAFYCEYFV